MPGCQDQWQGTLALVQSHQIQQVVKSLNRGYAGGEVTTLLLSSSLLSSSWWLLLLTFICTSTALSTAEYQWRCSPCFENKHLCFPTGFCPRGVNQPSATQEYSTFPLPHDAVASFSLSNFVSLDLLGAPGPPVWVAWPYPGFCGQSLGLKNRLRAEADIDNQGRDGARTGREHAGKKAQCFLRIGLWIKLTLHLRSASYCSSPFICLTTSLCNLLLYNSLHTL